MNIFDESFEQDVLRDSVLVIGERNTGREISEMLADAGFRRVSVTALGQAREIVSAEPVGVVLMEMADSGQEELDFLRWLRRVQVPGEFLPVLVMAAGGGTRDDAGPGFAALAEGASDIVNTPVVPWMLRARLRLASATGLLYRRVGQLAKEVDRLLHDWSDAVDEERFLEEMTNTLSMGLVAYDAYGRLRYVNDAARRLGLDRPMPDQRPALAPGSLLSADGAPLTWDDDPLHRAWTGQHVVGHEITFDDPRRGRRVLVVDSHPIVSDPGRRLGAVAAVQDVTDDRRLMAELRERSLRDRLTGLPHIPVLLDLMSTALAQADRDHRPLAVIQVDVSEETRAGQPPCPLPDEALGVLAGRLVKALRQGDTGARHGDGFAVLCAAPVGESQARAIAARLREALTAPVQLGDRTVTPRLGVGVATARSAELSATALLQEASVAAIQARRDRTGTPVFLDGQPRQSHQERKDIESALRNALAAGELHIFYQPIVELSSGAVVAVESVARWRRSGHGFVAPAEFLPVAEQIGLMARLEDWILQTVCSQVTAWREAGLLAPTFWASVNLSPGGLNSPGWARRIHDVLDSTATDPGHLCLEIGEDDLTGLPLPARTALEALRAARIRLAVGDGRRGEHLHDLLGLVRFDLMKVDGSLARATTDATTGAEADSCRRDLVAVVESAHRFGVSVVAEGVESDQQASALVTLGCDLAQGDYYSRPLPAERITTLLRPTDHPPPSLPTMW